MAAGSKVCCLISVHLLQGNNNPLALLFVPKARQKMVPPAQQLDMQKVQNYKHSTGLEGTEEVRIQNWRAKERYSMEVTIQICIPSISEST